MKPTLALALCLMTARAAAAGPADIRCDAPDAIPDAQILLLGEMHGSVETPALAGRITCALARHGPVALALEIHTDEQAAMDAFLASDGGGQARAALLQGHFWRSRDGRSSMAKLALLERIRTLKQARLPVEVFTFIPGPDEQPENESHDAGMARLIREFHVANPDTRIVALMGNIHAMKSVIESEDFRLEPAGYFLADLDATSILVAYPAGTIWACMPECGLQTLPAGWGDGRPEGFTPESPRAGYDMSWVLPAITASPPVLPDTGDNGN